MVLPCIQQEFWQHQILALQPFLLQIFSVVPVYAIHWLTSMAVGFWRYGTANEAIAAARYEEVLKAMGHDITASTCGLLVNPAFPWLGALPDRIVFDPVELIYGVVEIKGPYSL
ncbi:hypothetical protein HPB49_007981 [Dermacentor silvarum]|uniref:Uncharacterized protein n=1 Tax=Dermacentor silvarum TaxID=543639 RepID=A0ACB8C885_DERSI|nr:hypothetical protein HPB49_007981 [Dermacentor silvarum]